MTSWHKICEILHKYAKRDNEMGYQKSIVDLLLEDKLGWHKDQIKEQMSIPIGSTERIIPDIIVTKDSDNKFVIEVKHSSHIKSQRDIDQLVSYMKLLEIPVGIYVGKELEIYYKTLGACLEPKLVMSLEFDPNDKNGGDFISLFSEQFFSTQKVRDFLKKHEEKKEFESTVQSLVSKILSPAFSDELKIILGTFFSDYSSEVIEAALKSITFDFKPVTCEKLNESMDSSHADFAPNTLKRARRSGRNNGVAQRYAYNLIKKIIAKNPNINFINLYNIFGHKNYIENIENIKDETRWCLDEQDIITLADNTRIAISNQWGFNGYSERKMNRLRKIAEYYGLDIKLP